MGMNYYVDKISLVFKDRNECYLEEKIGDKLFEFIQKELMNKNIERIEAENMLEMRSIEIFIDDMKIHLGVTDMYNDINYYMDNLSNDFSLEEISGNCFEKRFVSTDFCLLWDVFMDFSKTGDVYKNVQWYIEE